jgi:hypothetical protein
MKDFNTLKNDLLDPDISEAMAGRSLSESEYNLNEDEDFKIKNKKFEDYETKKIREKHNQENNNLANIISRVFDNTRPDYFATLTFKDNRINNGTYINQNKEDLPILTSEESKQYYNHYYKNNLKVSRNVSITKLRTGIRDFFYRGMYIGKKIDTDEYGKPKINNKGRTRWISIRTTPLKDLATHFFYVVEHGKEGNRRHVHFLARLRKDKIVQELITYQFNKNLHFWKQKYGFFNKQEFKSKHYNYLAKDQYILKDFNKNQYDNYENEFGYHNENWDNHITLFDSKTVKQAIAEKKHHKSIINNQHTIGL